MPRGATETANSPQDGGGASTAADASDPPTAPAQAAASGVA